MGRLHRISWALLLVATACGDDVTGGGDSSTGEDSSSTGGTVDPTNVTTTGVTETSGSTTDTTTGDPDTESTTSVDPDTGSSTTTGDTDPTTSDESSSSTGDESSSSSTGMPEDCGNGMVDEGEDCDGDDLDMATCESIGMGFTGGTLACADDCTFDTAACTAFDQPAAGGVIVSEIMPNPSVASDADGEWFELHNLSDTETYSLSGCEISGQEGEEVIVIDDLLIAPGEHLTFAPMSDADVGFVPDYEWDVMYFISNGGDQITLSCGGTEIDTVDYDTFPPAEGFSLNLDPVNYDATLNDDAASYCPGLTAYNTEGELSDFGTPGAINDECPPPVTYNIDFCRLQFPNTIVEDQGTIVTVFGRLFIGGLTDMSTGNDLAPEVSGQVGYGPDGTDPAVDAGWVWVDATDNPGYDGTAAGEPNNDEYQADLMVPAPGEYDFAYRFSGDSGLTYTYCDGQPAGSSDGYQTANAGQMTANDPPPPPDSLVLAEIYYDHPSADTGFTWAKLYNGTGSAIDLSTYSIAWGGSNYASSGVQLSGTIDAGACFLLGGPDGNADSGWDMMTPTWDLVVAFDPQNSGGTADGVALFDTELANVDAATVPIDAVIYGGDNTNNLIDETGMASPVDVGDAPNGDSILRLAGDTWIIQADPTPSECSFAG